MFNCKVCTCNTYVCMSAALVNYTDGTQVGVITGADFIISSYHNTIALNILCHLLPAYTNKHLNLQTLYSFNWATMIGHTGLIYYCHCLVLTVNHRCRKRSSKICHLRGNGRTALKYIKRII